MDDESVARFLIEKHYNLTALELMSEVYERSGITIDALSEYFQDSSNFLNFDMSVTSTDGDGMDGGSSETLRVKNDRIALLEHEVTVLKDQLREVSEKSESVAPVVKLRSPEDNLTGSSDAAEDAVIKNLVAKYLQSRGYKISAISFANESGKHGGTGSVDIPDNVELVSLLRSFMFSQNTAKITAEMDVLRREKSDDRSQIAQLLVEADVHKRRIAELEGYIEQRKKEIETVGDDAEKMKEEARVSSIEVPAEPPSVQLLNGILTDIKPLVQIIAREDKWRLLQPIQSIIRNHPSKNVRVECIEIMFAFYEDPTNEEREKVVKAAREVVNTMERADDEILPCVTQMMASTSASELCLMLKIVGVFSDVFSVHLRATLLFSIIRQFSEHSNSVVRVAAAEDGAALIYAFGNDDTATDKLQDVIDLSKQFIFDADGDVQKAGLTIFLPAVLKFGQKMMCVGRTMFEFWLKMALSFGLTGSSQIAVIRFRLCAQVLETIVQFLLPAEPTDEQCIACEGASEEGDIVAVREEYDWITECLPKILIRFSPILYVPIPIKKEASSLVYRCCKSMGKRFTIHEVAPAFLKLIEDGMDNKMQHLAMFLSSIACVDDELFYENTRKYVTYAANESHQFKQSDIEVHIGLAFSLLSSRDGGKRDMIMRLVDEFGKSSRAALRSAAVTIVQEIMPTFDDRDLESHIVPFVSRLANDPDEGILLETVNCVGSIARYTTSDSVIGCVKDLVAEWVKCHPAVKLQVLRSLTSNIGDVDSEFRDAFIVPKLLEWVQPDIDWGEQRDQAFMIVVQFIAMLKDDFSDGVIKGYVQPICRILAEENSLASDPMLKELRQRFKGDKGWR